MRAFLRELLVDPVTKEPLGYDAATDQLHNSRGETYPLRSGVPDLLVTREVAIASTATVHQRSNTSFDYRDHYVRDADYFDYFAPSPDGATRHDQLRLHQQIARAVPAQPELILDVGCGGAWVAQRFTGADCRVISLDISSRNPLRAHAAVDHPQHSGLIADVYQLPFAKNSIPTIIASEIIEHVPDPLGFLAQLIEVLAPGGRLVITTPYQEDIVYHLCVHCNQPTPSNAHLHRFDETVFERLLTDFPVRYTTETFGNKYLSKLRTHRLLGRWPFAWWRPIDHLAGQLFGKQTRIIVCIEK
jgi:SAM-dependent methyltransferase/uncharacterized protein YbaR (Trm112 family)